MTIRDTFSTYKKKSKNPVTISVYTKIINAYICYLMNLVFEGQEVKLPATFGSIRIKGRKQKLSLDENGNVKGLTPNWGKTKKLWDEDEEARINKKVIYNTNENTNGIIYKFHWDKSDCRLRYKSVYSLIMTRYNKRHLSKLITEQQKEY